MARILVEVEIDASPDIVNHLVMGAVQNLPGFKRSALIADEDPRTFPNVYLQQSELLKGKLRG